MTVAIALPYGSEAAAPDAVIARARALSVGQALEHFAVEQDWARENWDEVVEGHISATARAYGRRPDLAVVVDVPRGDELALERRLLAWEETERPTTAPEPGISFDWFDPRPNGPVGLVLLPLAEPCHARRRSLDAALPGPPRQLVLRQRLERRRARTPSSVPGLPAGPSALRGRLARRSPARRVRFEACAERGHQVGRLRGLLLLDGDGLAASIVAGAGRRLALRLATTSLARTAAPARCFPAVDGGYRVVTRRAGKERSWAWCCG